jgi:amidase
MDAHRISRRKFLHSAGLAAAALATGGSAEHASASAPDSTGLLDYDRYDGLGLAELVRKRQVTAHELLEIARQHVEQRNPATNAIVYPMYQEAETAISAGLPSGPFTGVPYVLKDLGVLYAGTITSSGSSAFRNLVADHDSEIVTRLKRAGLVIFGKTHSSEFGLSTSSESRLFGATRNPWNPEYSAGGSSGGSAAAIAVGMIPVAYATDGGGSIRIPASCCGLFGLKPTRARTPMGPDVGERWNGLGCAHAITRSVRDSAALLDATAGADVGDPYWAPVPKRPYLAEVGVAPGRLKIAFTTKPWNGHAVDAECIAAVDAAAKLCESLGHHVEEASPAIDESARGKAVGVIVTSQVRATLQRAARVLGRQATPEDVETITWAYAESARQFSGSDYAAAIDAVHRSGREVGRFFTRYDVLLTPTMCTPPHKLGVLSLMRSDTDAFHQVLFGDIGFTALFNTTGNPAMSVPLHWSPDGLPVGAQFVAPFGDEATLFRLAAQLEAAKPWADRRPVRVL